MSNSPISNISSRLPEALISSRAKAKGVDLLEVIVLEGSPTSAVEIVAMLDVAIPDLILGGRTDGRDILALRSIRHMLSTLDGSKIAQVSAKS